MLLLLVCFILLVKLNVKCRIDRPLRELTFLQDEIHHGHHVYLLHPHVLLHHHLLQPLILTGSHQNSQRHHSRVHGPAASSSSSMASTGQTRDGDIKCRWCQGGGHFAKDCPSKRVMTITADGGYESASDYDEETLVLIANEEQGA